MEWPPFPVNLARASELFSEAGHPAHPSSLSRFIKARQFPTKPGYRGAVLVDAEKLFAAFTADYSRQVMSGQASGASPAPAPTPAAASSAERLPGDDGGPRTQAPAVDPNNPKLRAAHLDVQSKELDLAQRLAKVAPVEEFAAASAEAMAELAAAFAQELSATADRLLLALDAPHHKLGPVRQELKTLVNHGRRNFAARMAKAFAGATDKNETLALERLQELALYALQLREGEGAEDAARVAELLD